MQRFVDGVLAVTKESVKTITYESLNNIARLINGFSALLLAFLPGKATILEGIHGWELRPAFRAPRLPRWMENGASSFNKFIYQLDEGSDSSSNAVCSPGEKNNAQELVPSPSSHSSEDMGSKSVDVPGHNSPSSLHSIKKVHSLKDHIFHRATDRRRGVMEDLYLSIEIFIEAIFDVVHKAAYFLLSPLQVVQLVFRWAFRLAFPSRDGCSDITVSTSTLAEENPTPRERKTDFPHPLNTDARTCEDVIKELGYPYEAIRVVTEDGYVLLLERLPRRDARKAVYFQHGILDSSMGWVSNGVVGSPAFAAFDQGYDVFLGNFRGLVSREHINKNISSREYWRYSVNEHGTKDIPAMMDKIHEIKTCELDWKSDDEAYKMCAICHSLGGSAILMYVITRRLEKKPHRLSRLVLLSPAGFHSDSNIVFSAAEFLFLWMAPILETAFPGFYIPTRFFRMLVNKLARDFHNYPAVGGLVQTLVSYFVGGDSSNWVGALGLPHYNMNDMPGLSFRVAHHLAQMKRSGKHSMYDYGSVKGNMEAYGESEPLDLGENYGALDVAVDLIAGRKDGVIRSSMVRKHYEVMRGSGVEEVTYSELEYAHLDFTFSNSEELLAHIMSRLLLMGSAVAENE